MPMYCNNFELEESRDDFLLRAEPPEAFALYPSSNPGPPGPPGPAGPGVAEGGTTGQLLAKASDEDYDTEWIDPPELDAGHVTYDDTETYEDGTVGKAVSDLNSAISETCTDATGLQLVDEEKLNTIYTEAFLNTLDRIFTELPQDDSLEDIYDEIVTEVSLLDQLYREVAAAVNA